MKKNVEKKCRRMAVRRSFTLIEVMIVVVILGLLTALVAPGVNSNLKKAKVNSTKAQLVALKGAVNNFYMDCSEYPSSLDELLTKTSNPKWAGPYLEAKNLPKDGWDNDFIYVCPGSEGMPFDIISYGQDKSQGGEEEAADLSCW